jgi:signal transduction histidine kinase
MEVPASLAAVFDDRLKGLRRLDAHVDQWATRAIGAVGQVVRFLVFTATSRDLGLDPLLAIPCAEVATSVYLIAVHAALPVPTAPLLRRRNTPALEWLDVTYLLSVMVPIVVFLIYLANEARGIAAAFVFSFASLGPHYVFQLLESRRASLVQRNDALSSASEELRNAYAALEGKQEELRTFLYAVTHDLKGPVNTIRLTADNGVGIPPAYHERVFELFSRVPAEEYGGIRVEHSGTGIGLAVARRIVTAHGGRIWVASAPGEGSCFYLWLPSGPPAA